jgi:hypothetical protein
MRPKEEKKIHFCNVRTVPTALALDRLITKIPDEELQLQLGYAYQCISPSPFTLFFAFPQ